MEERFDRCVKKYEGCMQQLKKAERLLSDILEMIYKANIHLGIEEEIDKYFKESKYNEIANERRNDNEGTRLQSKFEEDS